LRSFRGFLAGFACGANAHKYWTETGPSPGGKSLRKARSRMAARSAKPLRIGSIPTRLHKNQRNSLRDNNLQSLALEQVKSHISTLAFDPDLTASW
jgi:hypothetical protein